ASICYFWLCLNATNIRDNEFMMEWFNSLFILVSRSSDQTVRLWDAATGLHQQTFKGHLDCVNTVAFSPDSSTVMSGSSDRTFAYGMQQPARIDKPLRDIAAMSGR